MPVDRTLGSDLADTVVALYSEAELVLTNQIARRIGTGLGDPEWAQKRMAQVGEMRRIAERVTARLAADSTGLVAQAVEKAYGRGGENALKEMARLGGTPRRSVEAIRSELTGSAAVQRLANALTTRLGGTHLLVVRETVDAYRRVISSTVASGTLQGTETRRESAQRAMLKFAAAGIAGFTDRAGRNWQLTSYAEMATRTGTAQAAVEGHLDRLDALDIDLVIVSNAPQECERCRPWEGKVLARSGPPGARTVTVEHATQDGVMVKVKIAGTVDEAIAKGFMHPQCRHSLSAYLAGVTKPITNTEDPEGDKARQQQRALERAIRKAKLQEAASLDTAAQKAAKAKVDAANADLKAHLAENPALKRLRYREQIGAGNLPTAGTSNAGVNRPVVPEMATAKPAVVEPKPKPAAAPAAPKPAAPAATLPKAPAKPVPAPKAPTAPKPIPPKAKPAPVEKPSAPAPKPQAPKPVAKPVPTPAVPVKPPAPKAPVVKPKPAVEPKPAEVVKLPEAPKSVQPVESISRPEKPAPAPAPKPAAKPAAQPKPVPAKPALKPGPQLGDLFMRADSSEEDVQAIHDATRDRFDGTYANLTVQTYEVHAEADKLIVSGLVSSRNGTAVGEWQREYYRDKAGDPAAYHGYLQLDPSVQGQGFAKAFNAAIYDWYRASGLKYVKTKANVDVGGYAWARQGWDFSTIRDARGVLDRLRKRMDADGVEQEERAAAQALLQRAEDAEFGSDTFPTAFEISQLGRQSGRDTWLGKVTMLGSDWNAVLWL